MEDGAFLAALWHHRWAVPALAAMRSAVGSRTAELAHGLGASRGGVNQALGALVELRLVARNPGHGHPLRPEYVLTARGMRAAPEAERIVERARRWSIEEIAFRKWPLVLVWALGDGSARFADLRARLPVITDRALSDALRSLATSGLAERRVHAGHPPAVEYRPTARSRSLLPALRALARLAS